MTSIVKTGYCTNVHAGVSLSEVKSNLEKFAVPIGRRLNWETIPVGLWLSNQSSRELIQGHSVAEFGEWLKERKLQPYTFNGFPFQNFHERIVKKNVYLPTWEEDDRRIYTENLACIQAAILGENEFGSISTLPLGWRAVTIEPFFERCTKQILQCFTQLKRIHEQTGCHVFLCIEPEPGCALDTADLVVDYFQNWLFKFGNENEIIEYVGVCHDICHSAVMFEAQNEALSKYTAAGIQVGKYQISSAVEVNFDNKTDYEIETILHRLASFAEDRYLHQTVVKDQRDQRLFFDDLENLLGNDPAHTDGQWRIHFHVPIFLETLGPLNTTQSQIRECLAEIQLSARPVHFEIETYAWSVLPEDLRPSSLADGIARELRYFQNESSIEF